MASRKVRLKIDAGDDLADHKEHQPNLKPVITRPRPPADALPLPPESAPSAPRALPPVRAPQRAERAMMMGGLARNGCTLRHVT